MTLGMAPQLLASVQEEGNLNEMTNMSNVMIHDLSLNYSEDIHKTLTSKLHDQTDLYNPEQTLGQEVLTIMEQSLLNYPGTYSQLKS